MRVCRRLESARLEDRHVSIAGEFHVAGEQAQHLDNGLTLRQVVESASQYRPGPFVGSPQTVADTIQTWFEGRAFDGINLAFRLTEDLEYFIDSVVPILQKRGLFRTEYEADTLRGNLGLPFPVNQFAAEAEAEADSESSSKPAATQLTGV